MEYIHQNYDSVFKEAMTLFKDKALDFLGLTGVAPITEPLMTESVEIEIKIAFRDLSFGTQDNRGVHFEEEVDLSNDDMLRIGGYNLWLGRAYKKEFVTVIFVKNPTLITELKTEQMHFKPIIVQCSKIDADAMLADLKQDVADGKPINELKLVYLPLFHSVRLNPTELFKESAKLIMDLQADDNQKRKIYALSTILAGKVVDKTAIEAVLEEVKKMGNVIIEVAEAIGEKRKMEETAKKMLADNLKLSDIIKYTGIDVDRLGELRDAVHYDRATA